MNNSVENHRVEYAFRLYKIRAKLFGGLKELKSKKYQVP